jgi:hypothetical protein
MEACNGPVKFQGRWKSLSSVMVSQCLWSSTVIKFCNAPGNAHSRWSSRSSVTDQPTYIAVKARYDLATAHCHLWRVISSGTYGRIIWIQNHTPGASPNYGVTPQGAELLIVTVARTWNPILWLFFHRPATVHLRSILSSVTLWEL